MAKVSASALFDQIAGRLDAVSVVRTRTGLAIRRAPKFRKVLTPAQHETTVRLKASAELWHDLTRAEVAQWQAYADSITLTSDTNGKRYHPIAYNAFTRLTTKWMQMHPDWPETEGPPRTPPLTHANLSSVALTVQPIPGGLRVGADYALPEGQVIELLYQRLPGPHRRPGNQYVTLAFVEFEPGSLWVDVPFPPGSYALAYRTAFRPTGEQSPLGILGAYRVE
ncbi:MAG TPA: hypothetical protein PLL78_05900 [Fimbriimonadaceae bacterium]|nr:hypothetical protein [Fimbriimonadaceae bacterium]HRJ96200.1 hypothetical protein [Fimbriimonadaceae bacterium]